MLEVAGLHARYGKLRVLHDVSLSVASGAVVTVLGANGAGKTTLLKVISGLMRPETGTVTFAGQRIDAWPAERVARSGLVHVPEGRQLFAGLSVAENLKLGAYPRNDRAAVAQDLERVYTYFPVLAQRRAQKAGTLSGGEQQMLAIGRGLMARPRVLLLDEPSLGLAPRIVAEIFAIVRRIAEEGTAIVLVEQNVYLALDLAEFGYVLDTGRVTLSGPSGQLRENAHVRDAYLGARGAGGGTSR